MALFFDPLCSTDRIPLYSWTIVYKKEKLLYDSHHLKYLVFDVKYFCHVVIVLNIVFPCSKEFKLITTNSQPLKQTDHTSTPVDKEKEEDILLLSSVLQGVTLQRFEERKVDCQRSYTSKVFLSSQQTQIVKGNARRKWHRNSIAVHVVKLSMRRSGEISSFRNSRAIPACRCPCRPMILKQKFV